MFKLLLSGVMLCSVSSLAFADSVGVREIQAQSSERGKPLDVMVWYPAADGGEQVLVGDNKLFVGTEAFKDAPAKTGQFPLVLMSHGSGGNVRGLGWLASKLAEAGYIVAAPNHPGTTSGDSLPSETPKIWQRTRDLSDVLDRMTTDADFAKSLDAARIGVVGFSLGGAAAMEIAGARASLDAYIRYCNEYTLWDCAFYAGGVGYRDDAVIKVDKVDLRTIDRARFEQSNQDPRIKAAVMVDPGLALAYVPQSVQAIDIPMSFINLGNTDSLPFAIVAETLAALAPKGTWTIVKDANHFSFLSICKPGSAETLKAIGEIDPICDDVSQRSRQDIHDEIAKLTIGALNGTFKAGQ